MTPSSNETITVIVDIENKGKYDGEEIVELYTRDLVASSVRPIKELKGFEKVFIKSGEKITVEIPLDINTLGFFTRNLEYIVEPGEFEIMVGTSSEKYLKDSILVK